MDDSGRTGLEPGPAAPGGLRGALHRSALWRSIFRHPQLETPRGRALQGFSNFFLHVYPIKIPERVLRVRYSFRLGFIAAMLFAILTATGVYLMFFYTPQVTSAYGDMQALRTAVGFGQLMRNVHRWAAHLMVVVAFLHMVRVFYAGAYKKPREYNWVIGVFLLLATLALSFTGYLLPWDQLSYWAVTVGTNIVNYMPLVGGLAKSLLIGGDQIGQTTLLRFYALHVVVLPGILIVLLGIHIWRVRKDGFAVQRPSAGVFEEEATRPPDSSPPSLPASDGRVRLLGVVDRESVTAEERPVEDSVFTWPHLLVRHAVVALGTLAAVLTLGVAFAAPLKDLANPALTPEPAKAPWYFAGLQELLSHLDPLIAGVLIPAGAVAVLLMLPYMDRNPMTEARNRKVAIILFSILMSFALTLTIVGTFFRGPGWKFVLPWHHLYVEL
jgi:cytochrome b-561